MTIRQKVTIRTSPDKLYKALMAATEFSQVTGAPAEIAADEGGEFSCFGGQIVGRHIELHPNERIVQAWRVGSWEARVYSIVKFEISKSGEVDKAVAAYSAAEALVPDSHEMVFWHAATLAADGKVDESLPLFKKAFDMWPRWRELVQRLPASGLLPDDPELMEKILSVE